MTNKGEKMNSEIKSENINMEIISRVAKYFTSAANEKGIDLQAQFGTKERWIEFVIAVTFKGLTDAGASTEKAWDILFGRGAYEELFEAVCENAKAAASRAVNQVIAENE